MWKVLGSVYWYLWGYLYGPLFFPSVSSYPPSVALPGYTISSGLIQFHYPYSHLLCTVACSVELRRQSFKLSWSTKLCRRWNMYWQGVLRLSVWGRQTGCRSNLPFLQHCWILGVWSRPYFVKHKLYEISKRVLGYTELYRQVLRARKLAGTSVLGMCELSLKLENCSHF